MQSKPTAIGQRGMERRAIQGAWAWFDEATKPRNPVLTGMILPAVHAAQAAMRVCLTGILLISLLAGSVPWRASALGAATAYVEPGLYTTESDTLSVIVTASHSREAARAVERVGGHVSSDLWLIDAVGVTVPAAQLHALATCPGVLSIVDNRTAQTADGPAPPGWVMDDRGKGSTLSKCKLPRTPVMRRPATLPPSM